jgi:nicotinate-nucleotide--dimethylbenzimidazole phosphoribosyltransferase
MSDRDGKVDSAYRALGREEPPPSLDAKILAASRAALAQPSLSRRWAAPVSIAAVLVLAFGVTLHMQREQPGVESPDMDAARPAERKLEPEVTPAAPTPAPAATDEKAPESPAVPAQQANAPAKAMRAAPREEFREKKKVAPQAKPDAVEADRAYRGAVATEQERKDLGARAADSSLAKEAHVATIPAFTPPPPAAPAAPAAAAAPATPMRLKREALAAQAPAGALADAQAVDEPTRELEAIAKLRAEGRHEEADKALAEFRRKRPGYRIPDAMWARVKPG